MAYNDQGLDVRDGVSERMNILHMCPYKYIVVGALMLEIISIADYQAHVYTFSVFFFCIFPNTYIFR